MVEQYIEGKGSNGCQHINNLEEEQNPDIQGYAQALKSIIIDLNQEDQQPTHGEGGILR